MKKLLIGFAVVIVLIVAAAIAIPFLVPLETYKEEIAARVRDATGRELTIKGDIKFSLLPRIELEVDDVEIAFLRNLLIVTASRSGFIAPVLGPAVDANVERVGLAGLALTDPQGTIVAATPSMPPSTPQLNQAIARAAFRRFCPEQLLRPGDDVRISNVVLLFTDLKGSTSLYEAIGDAAAYKLVRDHFEYLTEVVEAHHGTLIKTMGDAIMAAFSDGWDAVTAAIRLQSGVADFNHGREDGGVILKIGLHQGATDHVLLEGLEGEDRGTVEQGPFFYGSNGRFDQVREIFDGQFRVAGHDDRLLDGVLEFPYVARPAVAMQQGPDVPVQQEGAQAMTPAGACQEIVGQFLDVPLAFPQGRDVDRHDVQPVEQVVPEPAATHRLLQVLTGGGQNAHIDPPRRR